MSGISGFDSRKHELSPAYPSWHRSMAYCGVGSLGGRQHTENEVWGWPSRRRFRGWKIETDKRTIKWKNEWEKEQVNEWVMLSVYLWKEKDRLARKYIFTKKRYSFFLCLSLSLTATHKILIQKYPHEHTKHQHSPTLTNILPHTNTQVFTNENISLIYPQKRNTPRHTNKYSQTNWTQNIKNSSWKS